MTSHDGREGSRHNQSTKEHHKGEAMNIPAVTARVSKLTLSLACAMILATTTKANLLINGNFEEGPGGYFSNVPVGSTIITGWVVTRGTIDYDPGWQCPDGTTASLDLDGSAGSPDTAGGIEQTFATVSNQQYIVTFAMAANPDNNPNNHPETMVVQAAGQSGNFSFSATGHSDTNMGWVYDDLAFTASGPSTTLEFYSTDQTNEYYGPTLADVSVVAVPEPMTFALVAFALLGLFATKRR